MATDIFRVYAYDLNTNSLITELPASSLSFDSRLNDAGSISLSLPISRPDAASRVKPLMSYSGTPFEIHVDRDGVIVWSGIIWTWNYSRAAGVLSLGGKEFLSYFAQRFTAKDYSLDTYPFTRLTAYATAPVSTLTVESTTGFTAGMKITVGVDAAEVVEVQSVTAPYTITLVSPTVNNHPATAPVSYSIDPAALVKLAVNDAQTVISTTLSANVSVGGTALTVVSNTGFFAGQFIQVGGATSYTVDSVAGATTINLTSALTSAYSSGATVTSNVGGNIGISVVGGTSTIPAIIPSYPFSGRTSVANLIKDMSNINSPGAGTVDTTITSTWVSGNPSTVLTISSPRAGRIGSASGLIFDLSRVLDYTWATDGASVGTTIVATGGTGGISSTVRSSAPVGSVGQMPRLDKVVSFSNVRSQSQLDAMSSGLSQQFGYPVPTPTVTQPTSVIPYLSTFSLGDDARLYIKSDERFPDGLDEYWRIIQFQVQVPEEGVPTVTFTFNKPPSY